MNRTVNTVQISYTLPPVERGFIDDRGGWRRDEGRCRADLEVTTYMTTCSTQAQFRGKDGKLRAGGMQTIRLYGVQGVPTQPAIKVPRAELRVDVTEAAA